MASYAADEEITALFRQLLETVTLALRTEMSLHGFIGLLQHTVQIPELKSVNCCSLPNLVLHSLRPEMTETMYDGWMEVCMTMRSRQTITPSFSACTRTAEITSMEKKKYAVGLTIVTYEILCGNEAVLAIVLPSRI